MSLCVKIMDHTSKRVLELNFDVRPSTPTIALGLIVAMEIKKHTHSESFDILDSEISGKPFHIDLIADFEMPSHILGKIGAGFYNDYLILTGIKTIGNQNLPAF